MANRFTVGNLDVLVVSDGDIKFPATGYFPNSTEDQWRKHERWLDHEGNLTFSYSSFVVRSGDRTVLIDAGVGDVEHGPFKGGRLISELADAGVQPAEIDAVFLTHCHLDHCGWVATTSDGGAAPTFPNATVHMTSIEMEYWQSRPDNPFFRHDARAIVESRFQPVEAGASVAPGITVMALPGHTPGHAGVVLSSGDERAMILGDAISCPAQLEEPEWSGMGDVDPKLARRSQKALLKEAEGTGALIGAAHFPGLTFGRVLRGEGRRYWQPV